MKPIFGTLIWLCLAGCNSKPSLQQYFVKHTDDKDFIAVDVSPSLLNLNEDKMSVAQKASMKSFEKINIIAFKANDSNKVQFETERAKVVAILKDPKYQQLMKFGSGKEGASVSFVGSDEHIDEFVLFANRAENGFAVVRVLGKDMNPTGILSMIETLRSSNVNLDQLKPLQDLITKK